MCGHFRWHHVNSILIFMCCLEFLSFLCCCCCFSINMDQSSMPKELTARSNEYQLFSINFSWGFENKKTLLDFLELFKTLFPLYNALI